MRNWLIVLLAVTVAVVGLAGCKSRKAVNVVGSTSVQSLASDLAKQFNDKNEDIKVTVQGGGSTAGVTAVQKGTADIGTCSRALSAKESETCQGTEIALDGVAIVVHPDNPVKALTTEQAQQIFSGQVTNWKDVGGNDEAINVVVREAASGTREAFNELVMHHGGKKVDATEKALVKNANGTVREAVRNDKAAIGYMSLGLVGSEVRALVIDGQQPTVEAIAAGKYRLYRPFMFVTRKDKKLSAEAQKFLDYVLSDEGQKTVVEHGLISVKSRAASTLHAH